MLLLKNLHAIFKDLPVNYVVTLPDAPVFSIVDVNNAFLQLSDSNASELLEKGIFEVLPKLSSEIIKNAQGMKERINDALKLKTICRLSTGNWNIDFNPILDENEKIQYIVQTFAPVLENETADNLLQLKREKEKYQRLFNISPIPQFVYSITTLNFLDINDAAINHYGYTRDELLSLKITDIRPIEDVEMIKDIVFNTLEKGVKNSTSARHKKKNGEIINVIVEGNSIYFQNQEARLVLVIDNTEKIKQENALLASERRFKALIQEGSDLIAIMDTNGYYQYINPTTKAILGLEIDELIGKKGMDFVHPDDRKRVLKQSGHMEFQRRVHIDPFRFRIAENEYRWIESIMMNMIDDPAIGGIITNSRDVTRQIENEKKMEESIARFGIVSKATSDAIWDHDMTTGKVVWNKGMKGIFGHNKTHYTHNWWRSQVHPDDVGEVMHKVRSLINNKISRLKVEYRFRCADGTYKYAEDRAFVLFDRAGEAVRMIGSMQDITDRVTYIKAMEQQNDRLKEISWMQSHHVRAPLARIMGLTGLLVDKDNNDESETQEFLQYLTDSSTELDEIIKEIVRKTEGL